MIEPLGENAKHKRLHPRDRLVAGGSVGHCPWNVGNFREVAAVLLDLDYHFHELEE